jgi:hypothetical protein
MNKYEKLIGILMEVNDLIKLPQTDLIWTNYNNVEEVISEINSYITRLREHDTTVFDELKMLFAPTGSLQEISIDSGWGNYFIELSSRFDDIVASE